MVPIQTPKQVMMLVKLLRPTLHSDLLGCREGLLCSGSTLMKYICLVTVSISVTVSIRAVITLTH